LKSSLGTLNVRHRLGLVTMLLQFGHI